MKIPYLGVPIDSKHMLRHSSLMWLKHQKDKVFIAGDKDYDIGIDCFKEPSTTTLITQLLEPGMRFVDAGAAIGYFTRIASHIVGETGQVYAFEPTPKTFDTLSKNVESLRNVKIFNVALGDGNRAVDLHISPKHSDGNSIIDSEGMHEAVKVEMKRLDELISGKIDLIKIDVEGFEKNVLLGMGKLLDYKDIKLVFEYNHYTLYRTTKEYNGTINLLNSKGFHIREILDKGLGREDVKKYTDLHNISCNLFAYR